MHARSESKNRLRNGAVACDIVVLVDEEIGHRNSAGRFIVDRPSMEAYVLAALGKRYERVCVLPFEAAITPTIEAIRKLKPRVVFNLTEWLDGNRRLDAAIAGVLEMMGVTYTGAGPEALQLARDKALAKSVVAELGVLVPGHTLVNGKRPAAGSLAFPMVVKPQFGDGSEGIGKNALVATERQLEQRLSGIRRRSDEAILCEEYVPGRDLFVALLGKEPEVMPPLELVVGRTGASAPRIATFNVKHDAAYRRKWSIRYRRAELARDLLAEIDETSRRIFHALKLRDYARIDYRLTPDDRLVFIEANPNPDLSRHTFGREVCFAGVPYPELISRIVSSALERSR